ncbi:MAG: hypothetical protein ACOH1M_10515 [Rhodoglobus sp.]
MIRSILLGLAMALVAHLIALRGLLVSVGVFGESEEAAAGDVFIYVAAGLLSLLWGIAAWFLPSIRPKVAVLSFIGGWAVIGLATFSLNLWWLLSVAVVGAGGMLGLLLASLFRARKNK